MKRLLNYTIIISLSLVVFGCGGPTIDMNSDEGYYIEITKNKIATYKGVLFSGTIVVYYKNGQLGNKGTYKDGELDGTWEEYYENGQLREKRTYKDGKQEGDTEYYDENGQPE